MDVFLKRIKQEIDKGITVINVRSKEMIDNAKLNSQIVELTEEKNQLFVAIGVIVYQMFQGQTLDSDGGIAEKCKLVANLDLQIEAKELELKRLRMETMEAIGKAICESCGTAMDIAAKYCSNCGARMVKLEKPSTLATMNSPENTPF